MRRVYVLMTTNVTLIGDALKLLGVIGETQTPSPEQGALGLRVANRMLESWTEDLIELGWFEQTLTTDDAPLPKWAELGVVSKLAQALRPYYPASTLEPWVLDDTMNGFQVIQRNMLREQLRGADMSHMAQGTGHVGAGYDITTDT